MRNGTRGRFRARKQGERRIYNISAGARGPRLSFVNVTCFGGDRDGGWTVRNHEIYASFCFTMRRGSVAPASGGGSGRRISLGQTSF